MLVENDVDSIEPIARRIVDCDFDALPDQVKLATKRAITKCIASAGTAVECPAVMGLITTVCETGGRAESAVLLHGVKLPAHEAVLLNVAMSPVSESAFSSLASPAVWGALATMDALGEGSGKALMTAVALGIDVGLKFRKATPDSETRGHHPAIYAGFAAAVSAAKLRKLEHVKLRNALGVMLSQAAASMQAAADCAPVNSLQTAFNASDGLRSVMLADVGVTGVRRVLDGPFGLLNLFSREPNREPLMGCDKVNAWDESFGDEPLLPLMEAISGLTRTTYSTSRFPLPARELTELEQKELSAALIGLEDQANVQSALAPLFRQYGTLCRGNYAGE